MGNEEIEITDFYFGEEIKKISGENIYLCYQCKKCSNGCPVSYLMDYPPNQIIHSIRLGLRELVLNSKTIWLCASCETCTTRCPQEIDLVKVMDTLRSIAVRYNIKPKIPDMSSFYRIALSNIKFFGRMHELSLISILKLSTRQFAKDLVLGLKMLKKGKLKILPSFRGFFVVKKIFSEIKNKERK